MEIQKIELSALSSNFLGNLKGTLSRHQQLAVIIADGFEPLQEWEILFRMLRGLKQEFWLFQVQAKEEIKPSYSGDVKLIDSERGAAVNVSMSPSVLAEYEKRLKEHNEQLEILCKRYGGQYIYAPETRDLQTVLFRDLYAKGLVR